MYCCPKLNPTISYFVPLPLLPLLPRGPFFPFAPTEMPDRCSQFKRLPAYFTHLVDKVIVRLRSNGVAVGNGDTFGRQRLIHLAERRILSADGRHVLNRDLSEPLDVRHGWSVDYRAEKKEEATGGCEMRAEHLLPMREKKG